MLKSSLLILFLINIYFNQLTIITAGTLVVIVLNMIYNKDLEKNLKNLKLFLIFYSTTFFFQFMLNQEGEVLFKIFNFYITRAGVYGFFINFFRVFNLLLLSWIVTSQKLFNNNFGKYQRVIENVMSLVPEVITAFKKRIKLKWFFRHILKQVKIKS